MSVAAAAQGAIELPSGQRVTLTEVLIDEMPGPQGPQSVLRFRFLAPALEARQDQQDGTVGPVAQDMDHLCEAVALPYLDDFALRPHSIIISMSDRPVPFGASDPDAIQFFDAYQRQGSRCVWEGL